MSRVGKLAANGHPLAGAKNLYVSDAIISLTMAVELKAGQDFEQNNGCGNLCFAFKERDQIKGLDMQVSFCHADPELAQLLSGGDLITDGGDTIGYAAPEVGTVPNPDGVSLEVWTKNIDGSALDNDFPYVRWVFGRTFWTPDSRTFAEGPIVHPYTGNAEENDNFGDGPANDWPWTSDRLWQYAGDTVLPSSECGASELVAS
jgi:hypothetical protein